MNLNSVDDLFNNLNEVLMQQLNEKQEIFNDHFISSEAIDSSGSTDSVNSMNRIRCVEFIVDNKRWLVNLNSNVEGQRNRVNRLGDNDIKQSIKASATIITDSLTLLNLVNGKLNPIRVVISGKVKVTGDRTLLTEVMKLIKNSQTKTSISSPNHSDNRNTKLSNVIHRFSSIIRVDSVKGVKNKISYYYVIKISTKPFMHKKQLIKSSNIATTSSSMMEEYIISKRYSEFFSFRRKLIEYIQLYHPQLWSDTAGI